MAQGFSDLEAYDTRAITGSTEIACFCQQVPRTTHPRDHMKGQTLLPEGSKYPVLEHGSLGL